MDYKAPVESYSGSVREVTIGQGSKAVKIGGESKLAYNFFDEGSIPNPPRFALEVRDTEPDNWAPWVLEPYKDVVSDPVKWAQKCVEYGAEMVCLRLASTDPVGKDASPKEAAEAVKKVADAVSVPLIVYGSGDDKKDAEVLPEVAATCSGQNLLLGPALKENYEVIAKAAQEHGHTVIAQTPLDINLMKELNIKLSKTFPPERVVIDPLSSGLGYGMEYSFTIMERTKHTGVMFKDAMTQMPIIADLAEECWKTKEAKASKEQGILWESMTALSLLLAGANIVVLRHPETLGLVREILKQE
ncbi:MAG: acetyl-CoA decarbonylase/synthase complex subunit delta [Chloroflexi bacterium]|nr:MAG: acetyl-CoA decarbonylase/synthase complex subunit delta [Chloroflexota bacterium]RLC97247.1 MAG: acetyl-CoA decarbonylase/synthase complex subunit delta [Chloroflexota bacterium]